MPCPCHLLVVEALFGTSVDSNEFVLTWNLCHRGKWTGTFAYCIFKNRMAFL